MYSEWIRKFKITMNHRRRVKSIIVRSNEEIVRALDKVRKQFLEAERKEDKDEIIQYRSMKEVLEWLIDETT